MSGKDVSSLLFTEVRLPKKPVVIAQVVSLVYLVLLLAKVGWIILALFGVGVVILSIFILIDTAWRKKRQPDYKQEQRENARADEREGKITLPVWAVILTAIGGVGSFCGLSYELLLLLVAA